MTNEGLRVFDGATAVITGGASGIGRALGEELAGRGAEVVLADRQIERAEEAADGIRGAGGKATAAELDVRELPAVRQLIQETVDHTGRLDYMFNNAGISAPGDVSLHEIEDWDTLIDVNLRGVIHGVHAAYRIMIGQGFGHIVNTSSGAGLFPVGGGASYVATKHAVVGLSTSLRIEAVRRGVRVSVLCPGPVQTDIMEGGKYGRNLTGISPEAYRRKNEKMKPIPAALFAHKALDAIARNKAIIIIPAWCRLLWWTYRLIPIPPIALAGRSYRPLEASELDRKSSTE